MLWQQGNVALARDWSAFQLNPQRQERRPDIAGTTPYWLSSPSGHSRTGSKTTAEAMRPL